MAHFRVPNPSDPIMSEVGPLDMWNHCCNPPNPLRTDIWELFPENICLPCNDCMIVLLMLQRVTVTSVEAFPAGYTQRSAQQDGYFWVWTNRLVGQLACWLVITLGIIHSARTRILRSKAISLCGGKRHWRRGIHRANDFPRTTQHRRITSSTSSLLWNVLTSQREARVW